MALKVNQYNLKEQLAAPQTSTGSADNAIKKPINMKVQTNNELENKNNTLKTYIQSEEFNKLDKETQLKELKAKFYPNSTIEEIQKILTTTIQAIKTEEATENQIETQQVYADIDELKAKAKSGAELTEEEQQIIKQHEDNKMLIPIKEIMSEEFSKKTPQEKMSAMADAYFSKHDNEYKNLKTKEEKDQYLKTQLAALNQKLNAGSNEKLAAMNTLTLLQYSHEKAIPLKELENLNTNDLKAKLTEYQYAKAEEMINVVKSKTEGLEGKTASEKISICADTVLSMTDDKYKSLPENEKKQYREAKIDKFMTEVVGDRNWKYISDEKVKEKALEKYLQIAQILYKNKLSIADYKKLSQAEKLKMDRTILSEDPIKNAKEIKILNTKLELIEGIEKDNITDKDIYDKLRQKEKTGKLSDEEQAILNEYKYRRSLGDNLDDTYGTPSNQIQAAKQGQTVENYLTQNIDAILNDDSLTPEQKYEKIQEFYKGTARTGECDWSQVKIIDDVLRKNGYSNKEIHALRPEGIHCRHSAHAIARNDGRTAGKIACDGAHGSEKTRAAMHKLSQMVPAKLDAEQAASFGTEVMQVKELRQSFITGQNDRTQVSREKANDIANKILTSADISDASRATYTQEFITDAKRNGAEEQIYFGESLSKIENAAVTEGLAAASNSVDESVRSQYNSYVETAAKNYPPEQQAAIKNAMSTGNISKETLADTTPSPVNTTTQPQRASAQENKPAPSSAAAATAAQRNNTAATKQPAVKIQTADIGTVKNTTTTTQKTVQQQTASNNNTVTAQNSVKTQEINAATEKRQLEAKRDAAAENALNTAETIKKSVAEDSLKIAKDISQEASEEVVNTLAEEKSITEIERQKVIEKLSKASSITELYSIITSLGRKAQDIFLDKISKSQYVNEFINGISDTSVLQKLYDTCGSDSTKRELLAKMSDRIYKLLEDDKISDFNLGAVDHKIIRNFLAANVSSMSNTRFSRYLQYLPFDEREKLTEMRNKARGITQDNQANTTSQATEQKPVQTQANKKQDELNPVQTTKPKLAANEMRKTLADGTIITREGTTFGAISGKEDSYRVVTKQEQQEGNPIGMNDEILTPGSEEWKRKYNKQHQAPPATAFTMAAMSEEDEEFGVPFGSTKVSNRLKINKKFPPQGFRFNA